MKKRLVTAILVLTMVMVFAGCKKSDVVLEDAEPEVTDEVEWEEDVEIEDEAEEPETEPEPTEEPAEEQPAPKAAALSAELSDDIYSFQIQIDDTVYQFPMMYSDFEAMGWEYDGDSSSTLEPYQYTFTETWKKGDIKCYTRFANLAQSVLPYSECMVAGITLEEYYLKDKMTFIMPGGIQYMVSTKEDIEAAYGEPSYLYESDDSDYMTMQYKYDYHREVEFNLTDGVLKKVDIENLIEFEGMDTSSGEVSDEVPEIVSKYKAPKEVGDDFSTFNVEYDGALYTLPAPVAEFEANGWKIVADKSDETAAAQSYGWVTLMKNNQSLRVMANNYSDKAATINNCFVTKVEGGDYSTNMSITIPRGITRGMEEDKLKELLKDADYESEDSTSYTYYEIKSDRVNDEYEIIVRDGKVSKIEVSNSPRLKEWFK